MSTKHDYSRQAQTYDTTRGASPSVLRPLRRALAGAHRVLDVGGGTGNYAAALREAGFDVTVLDYNAGMLERAAAKGLTTIRGDAAALPFPDASWDAVQYISMLHHVPDWRAALAEGRRVVAPGGRVVLMGWSREQMEQVTWLIEYFPSTRDWLDDGHPYLSTILAELPGAEVAPVFLEDLEDMSMAALQRHPELILDPDLRRQTSYFERLAARNPDELAAGLERLRQDLDAGVDPRERVAAARAEIGDATLLCWRQPE
jgi:demethylmenaquinone methyltransferase/2-methoxy-6-polyprenyl-1,4-benzoquinol methylase